MDLKKENVFANYLKELRLTAHHEKTEHTDRTHFENLLKAVAQGVNDTIKVIHEPKRDKEGRGAPDFRIKNVEDIIGYIETKKTGADIEALVKSDQIQKYKKLSPNILITNYTDFIWIKEDVIKAASLGSIHHLLESKANTIHPNNERDVHALLKAFLSSPPKGIATAQELAKQLAPRSTILRDFFEVKLKEPENKDTLYDLYEAFKKRVFKDLRTDEFANAFAQMIAYGLFLARLHTDGTVTLTVDNAKNYIPKSFELIKQLARFLDVLHTKDYEDIRWVVDEIFSIINTFDFNAIHNDFAFGKKINGEEGEKSLKEKDPYVYFYENFLSEFDNDLRRKMGVYYTPLPVVKFIINGVDAILKDTFHIKNGFADNKVTALDFATGTGTFLVEMFKHVLDALPLNSGRRDYVIQNHLLKNFYGFEYMIAPYVIAHIKLSEFLKEQGYNLKEDERLGVYLTNTLKSDESLGSQFSLPGFGSLDLETQLAQKVKEKDILVIVGNPPYSVFSRHTTPGLIDAYKQVDGKSLNEKKHSLNDDYVKFIRFAQEKMDKVDEGIVGVITNHGFLDNPTFRGMRQSLMATFEQIYIFNLHGNATKREKCPDGSKDENVFDVKQGVCMTFFIKKNGLAPKIYHADLWGKRTEKFDVCHKETLSSLQWEELHPTSPNHLFIPWEGGEQEKLYESYWSLKDIFKEISVGVKTARDSLTIDMDAEALMKRVQDFASLPIETAREKYKLGKDSRDWQIAYAQKSLQESKLSKENVKNIHYRPFDLRKIYYTTKSKGFISYPLYNVMYHMLAGDNVGLVFVRQRKADSWQHSFVASGIMESCYISSGTGEMNYIVPFYLYSRSLHLESFHDAQKQENLTPQFREWIDEHYGHTYTPEDILGYIYAVLHSPTYRTEYREFLKRDFPRIPFTKDRNVFEQLSSLGWGLIQTHLMKDIPKLGLGDYCGQGNHTVEKISYDPDQKRLCINATQYFSHVPKDVFDFYIGGYQVLSKYFKSRKGRTLSHEDIINVENVVNILAFTIQHMEKIDGMYKNIKMTDNAPSQEIRD